MSSAIHQLQMAIVEGKQSLTQLLRQAKLISAKLNLEEVGRWVDLELGGYPPTSEPPPFRTYYAQNLEIHNPYQGGWRFAGNLNFSLKAYQPIAEIENYSQGDRVAFPVTNNFTIRDTLGTTSMTEYPQRFTVASSQFKRIIDAVTNELLRLTTELEQQGIIGENMSFDEKEKQTAGNLTFNIGTVHGAVGNVSNSPVTFYDNKTITQLFVERGIPKQDRRELEDILDELKTAEPAKKKSLVARAEELIVKHREAFGATAEIIVRSIKASLE